MGLSTGARSPARSADAWLEGPELVLADGTRLPVDLGLPGQFNRANAAMVALAAPAMTAEPEVPGARSGARRTIRHRAGRGAVPGGVGGAGGRKVLVNAAPGAPVRLLLAKNPAGWTAIFDLLDEDRSDRRPVVLSVNARTADGFDTSWLWDVPFERLAGRVVVATGDRRLDLGVRLRYAGVAARWWTIHWTRWTGPARRPAPTPWGHRPRSISSATTPPSPISGRGCDPAPDPESRAVPGAPSLTIAVVYPDLLGTYGDGGNGVILARRADLAWHRGRARPGHFGPPLPVADLYCIGGGEDGPQVRAAESLRADGTLRRRGGPGGGGAGRVRRLPAARPVLPRQRRPAP